MVKVTQRGTVDLGPDPQSHSLPRRAVPGEPSTPYTHLTVPGETHSAARVLGATECPSVQPSFGCCDTGQVMQVSGPPSAHVHNGGVEQGASGGSPPA